MFGQLNVHSVADMEMTVAMIIWTVLAFLPLSLFGWLDAKRNPRQPGRVTWHVPAAVPSKATT
jgi:hypothetical protein